VANIKYSFVGETTRKMGDKSVHLNSLVSEEYTHTHSFTELFYVIKGKGKFVVNGKCFDVKTGDSLIVAPDVYHTELSSNVEVLECMFVGIEEFPLEIDNRNVEYKLLNYDNSDHIMLDIVHMILYEVREKPVGYEDVCNNLLDMLQIYINRMSEKNIGKSGSKKLVNGCYVAKKYIEINYGEKITLDVLAEITYTNKYYLAHSFVKKYGITPINYLQKIRIERSKKYLENTDYSLVDISNYVGFSSQSYFSQIFKRHLGCTPAEYREAYSKDEYA